ncbi:MAG: DUF2341 domain-containing protein [Bacillota bacterium]
MDEIEGSKKGKGDRKGTKCKKSYTAIIKQMKKIIASLLLLTFNSCYGLIGFFRTGGGGSAGTVTCYMKSITFTSDSAKIPSSQTDFSALVSLSSDTNLANYAQDDGDDIVFTLQDGTTKISHEIEKFDGGTGELVVWVKVPTLATNTVIYMHYGSNTATNQQQGTVTWDSNYKGVWHLDETSGTVYDSTSNANNGTPYGVIQDVVGKINGADSFDGTDDYISVSSFSITSPVSFEFWIKAGTETKTNGRILVRDANSAGNRAFAIQRNGTSLVIDTWNSAGTWYGLTSTNVVTEGIWKHYIYTISDTAISLYTNGSFVNSASFSGSLVNPSVQLDMGCDYYTSNYAYHGSTDEVRISNIVRSANWITTSYNSQNDPSTFFSLGSQETSTYY